MTPHDIYGCERSLEEAVKKNPKWASARIRELEMQLENCRLDAEGVAVYIQNAKAAEDRVDQANAKLRELAEAVEERDSFINLEEPGLPDSKERNDFYDAKYQAWERYQAALEAAKEV